MDEPSEGLAPIIIQGVWEAIGKLKEEGLSILLVEQNASLALKLVDYVHVMSKGQVVYSARPEELRANDEIKSSYSGYLIASSALGNSLLNPSRATLVQQRGQRGPSPGLCTAGRVQFSATRTTR